MAEIPAVRLEPWGKQYVVYKWTGVTENDTCAPIATPDKNERTFQASGTFGGTTVSLQGTLDPAMAAFYPCFALETGAAVAITAAGRVGILQNDYAVKPVVTGGTSVSVNIWFMARED